MGGRTGTGDEENAVCECVPMLLVVVGEEKGAKGVSFAGGSGGLVVGRRYVRYLNLLPTPYTLPGAPRASRVSFRDKSSVLDEGEDSNLASTFWSATRAAGMAKLNWALWLAVACINGGNGVMGGWVVAKRGPRREVWWWWSGAFFFCVRGARFPVCRQLQCRAGFGGRDLFFLRMGSCSRCERVASEKAS